ncbi:unnamed protein product [Bursaphelenchus okinawaensis]|uniref:Uncharacterized protein n=1 Tax=Bursaphelenchus okinawaensis TaxID=465554 RepID=A0A811K0H7_9BILA|nr:unnamed protein product [Bursaphelenchus okinawaensis]CAG9088193.1 unnamed protein product [Bursaphelenchus okinawaensis]
MSNNIGRSAQCLYPGMMVEILNLLANTMNVEIEKSKADVSPNMTSTQAFEILRFAVQNDTIDEEMIRLVENEGVDTIAYAFQRTQLRSKRVLYSHKLYTAFWYSIQIHLGRPVQPQNHRLAVRFNTVFVSLMHVVTVLGLYSSWIVSQRLQKDDENFNGWNDFFQKLDQGIVYLALPEKSWFYERLLEAEVQPFSTLFQLYREKPNIIKFCKVQRDCLAWSNSSNAVFPLLDESTLRRTLQFYCSIVPPSSPLLELNARMIFKNGNQKLVEYFDDAIDKNAFLLNMIHNRYVSQIQKLPQSCPAVYKFVDQPYQGLLVIYAMLAIISCCIFLIEVTIYKIKC